MLVMLWSKKEQCVPFSKSITRMFSENTHWFKKYNNRLERTFMWGYVTRFPCPLVISRNLNAYGMRCMEIRGTPPPPPVLSTIFSFRITQLSFFSFRTDHSCASHHLCFHTWGSNPKGRKIQKWQCWKVFCGRRVLSETLSKPCLGRER